MIRPAICRALRLLALAIPVASCLLASAWFLAPSAGRNCCASPTAACSGSSSCSACTNCKRCAHCKGGGSCGVCRSSTSTVDVPVVRPSPAGSSSSSPRATSRPASATGTPAPTSVPEPTAKAAPSAVSNPFTAGTLVYLHRTDSKAGIPVAGSRRAFEKLIASNAFGDPKSLDSATKAARGSSYFVSDWTKAMIVEPGDRGILVKILEGNRDGERGMVFKKHLRLVSDPEAMAARKTIESIESTKSPRRAMPDAATKAALGSP